MICQAPWYVSNEIIHNDLNIPFVKDVIGPYSIKYKDRTTDHSNQLINNLFVQPIAERRLKRLARRPFWIIYREPLMNGTCSGLFSLAYLLITHIVFVELIVNLQ